MYSSIWEKIISYSGIDLRTCHVMDPKCISTLHKYKIEGWKKNLKTQHWDQLKQKLKCKYKLPLNLFVFHVKFNWDTQNQTINLKCFANFITQ